MKLYEFIDHAILNTIGMTKYKNYYFDETSSDALVDIIEVIKESSIGELELKEEGDDEVINEPDIVSWEEERKLEAVSEYQLKHELVDRMFKRNMEQYDRYCDDYEEKEDAETLANIEKYEDRLKYFIKK